MNRQVNSTPVATGRGLGCVSYVIRPKPGLATGTEIRNVATIQFDFGEVIDTNQIDPLAASSAHRFWVSWAIAKRRRLRLKPEARARGGKSPTRLRFGLQ